MAFSLRLTFAILKAMEELNKTQLILLALLVSFVTSIATGIVTVTLMDQAPPGVTQVINRVIEKTVETVVPKEMPREIVQQTQTVVVKEEDLIVKAAEKNARAVVRVGVIEKKGFHLVPIPSTPRASNDKPKPEDVVFTQSGIVFPEKFIVTSRSALGTDPDPVVAVDGELFYAKLVAEDGAHDLALLEASERLAAKEGTSTPLVFHGSAVGDSDTLRIGQTVISLASRGDITLILGVISRLDANRLKDSSRVNGIYTTLDARGAYVGGPILNTAGEIIGMNGLIEGNPIGIPSRIIKEFLGKKEPKKTAEAGEVGPGSGPATGEKPAKNAPQAASVGNIDGN